MNDSRPNRFVPFAYGFRPFFLLAGIYAVVALVAWLSLYAGGVSPLAGMPSQYWHAHEMMFGFVAAAIAGFLLTAVPSWTGMRGFAGRPLILLVALWLVGRAGFLAHAAAPGLSLLHIELLFLPALMLALWPSLQRSRSQNRPLLLVVLVFWVTDLVFHIAVARGDVASAATALRGSINLILLLITVIGGRIVPAFTGNALRARGVSATLRKRPMLEIAVIAGMLSYLVADIFAPWSTFTGILAAIVSVLHAVRLASWQGHRTLRQPLVWVLHVGYCWIPIGLLLRALYLLFDAGYAAYWQHALAAGAAGTMILAVMTRASLGHTGRPLLASRAATTSYLLLTAAILLRVFGPAVLPFSYLAIVSFAGVAWVLAFGLFCFEYGPILLRSRIDGKPG